jgi:hypothetical protein
MDLLLELERGWFAARRGAACRGRPLAALPGAGRGRPACGGPLALRHHACPRPRDVRQERPGPARGLRPDRRHGRGQRAIRPAALRAAWPRPARRRRRPGRTGRSRVAAGANPAGRRWRRWPRPHPSRRSGRSRGGSSTTATSMPPWSPSTRPSATPGASLRDAAWGSPPAFPAPWAMAGRRMRQACKGRHPSCARHRRC